MSNLKTSERVRESKNGKKTLSLSPVSIRLDGEKQANKN